LESVITGKAEVYVYISTQANSYTPAKTIYVCAPARLSRTRASAEQFAIDSGWLELAENDGAVLVMPIVRDDWGELDPAYIARIYEDTRKNFKSKSGVGIPGRDGFVWCWETLVYLVGYEDGAVYAGNTAVACPNRFAGIALVNGVPDNYSAASNPSSHWLVREVSADYKAINQDIPVCLWMFAEKRSAAKEAIAYFSKSNQITTPAASLVFDGIRTELYQNAFEEAVQVRISEGGFSAEKRLAETIMNHFFNKYIRWKNSPDGTLKPYLHKSAFYASDSYAHDSATVGEHTYNFFTYLPRGLKGKAPEGLPVVFSVHGRGEPAWIFATKNGWEGLADETEEFILVLPDSPKNIWLPDRDLNVFGKIIDKLSERYAIDKTRVYLTGFSNGGMITRQAGNYHPELFAAISPWNAPFVDRFDELLSNGYELPCCVFTGDNDEKAPLWEDFDSLLENMLKANKCPLRLSEIRDPMKFIPDGILDGENYYAKDRRYTDGDRFRTFIYKNTDGLIRVSFTLIKNMPHGAVYDESRAAWSFLKRFSRPENSKKVIDAQTDSDNDRLLAAAHDS
jgi:poly(3-hydroxybutyrate) depolymerase